MRVVLSVQGGGIIMRSSFVIAIATTTLLIGSAYGQDQKAPSTPSQPAAQVPAPTTQAPARAAPDTRNEAKAPAASEPSNPAVKTSEGNTPNATAPVAGANSFTEGEAK